MFISGVVFFERHGLDILSSLAEALFAGFGLCFVFVLVVGGVQFALGGGISNIGWDQVVSAVAISMVVSIVMLKALFYKLQNRPY